MAPILNYASQIQLAEFELFGVQKFWVGAVRYTKNLASTFGFRSDSFQSVPESSKE